MKGNFAWLALGGPAALLLGAAPAAAQQKQETDQTCRQAMATEWPELLQLAESVVRPPLTIPLAVSTTTAGSRQSGTRPTKLAEGPGAEAEFDRRTARLGVLCQNDREAHLALASVKAGTDVYRNPRRAIATLAANPAKPGDKVYARNLWLKVVAHSRLKDAAAFAAAWQELLDANELGLLGSGGWLLVEKGTGPSSPYAVYRSQSDPGTLIFLYAGVRKGPAVITAKRVDAAESNYGEAGYEMRYVGCSLSFSGQAEKLSDPVNPPYPELRSWVDAEYAENLARYPEPESEYGLLFSADCMQFSEIFTGLKQSIQFDGTEFVDPNAPLTEDVLVTWLASDDPEKVAKAVDFVTAHPDAVEPFAYIHVVSSLLGRGQKQQAAFWYYVFQIRSWPWRKTAVDQSGYPALYGSISYSLGSMINQWAGSDPAAMEALMVRAVQFERKAPLYARRPDHVSETKWRELIEQSRADRSEAVIRKMFANKPKIEAERRENGLYVGPWLEPGDPLPESWR